MFARGAFSKADAAAAGATLAAYAVGLVPFVLIRSAVATFYARKDTATPVKASLTGLTVNMGLKLLLMGAFAQVGLALATAVGAWVNLLLVLGFAVRAGYLELNRALWQSLLRFAASGVVLAAALWFAARFAASHFEAIRFRDETTLLLLIGVGAVVYAACVLLLFGPRWLEGFSQGLKRLRGPPIRCNMADITIREIGDKMAAPIKFGVGQSVLRKEDDALIRGKGRYTDDVAPQPALHALMLRSPHAHAKFTIDVARATGLPGVALILTAADIGDLGDLPCLFNFEVDPFTGTPYPILAKGEVRHVGDAVAFVVADTIDHARDAIEAIEVKWSPLPAVTGVVNAVKPGAPQVWPDKPGNILFDVPIGDKKATDAVFAKAHAVAEISIVNPRVVASFMETRAAVCEYDAKNDHLTLTVGSQGSHRLRDILCQNVLKIPTEKMRVICPDVGGGFGTKLFPYREYALMAVAARKLKKTVRWAADRTEHFMGDAQGRDNVTTARMALAEDGKFLAMDVDLMGDMGAYLSTFGPYIPHGGAGMLPGLYDIQAFHCRVRTVFTHTVPVDAYRGAGRPEAAYVIERLVDACARKLGMTPDAIRRKNFIPPRALPYKTATGKVYDSGDFAAHMKRAMEVANWKEFPKRAKAREEAGPRARHRHGELCRGLRHHGRGDRQCAARSQWRRHDPDRHAVERAGASDRLCADRRRAVRPAAGARAHPSGRHRRDRDRARHRRLGLDSDRRRQRAARHARRSAAS